MKVGVNALYLLPGAVGGTEIYLRQLLRAIAQEDSENEYLVFTNRETGADLVPASPRFHYCPQELSAAFRPARILYEQLRLPARLKQNRVDVLFNPGFTTPCFCGIPMVTVFHDLQHVRHPEHFKRVDLPFWQLLLFGRRKAIAAVNCGFRRHPQRHSSTLPKRAARAHRHNSPRRGRGVLPVGAAD